MTLTLSLLTACAFILFAGGYGLYRTGDRQKALLMAIAGLVLLGNVAIWAIPMP